MPPLLPGFAVQAAEEEEEEEDEETTEAIDLVKAGLFKESDRAIQGRTARGQTIINVKPFRVVRRKGNLEYYPCADCHEDEKINPKERKLTEEHETIVLDHGQGRYWCLTCHGSDNKNFLTSLKGKPIDFDFAFVLCGQCHFQRQKDWYFGGHGKRRGAFPNARNAPLTHEELKVEERDKIGKWKGTRVIYSCPACHNPHSPSIKPYKASPPPKARRLLKPRGKLRDVHPPVWERMNPEKSSAKEH